MCFWDATILNIILDRSVQSPLFGTLIGIAFCSVLLLNNLCVLLLYELALFVFVCMSAFVFNLR